MSESQLDISSATDSDLCFPKTLKKVTEVKLFIPCKPWIYWQILMVFLDGVKFVYHWSWIFFSYHGVIGIFYFISPQCTCMSRKCVILNSLFKMNIAHVWGTLPKRNACLASLGRIIIILQILNIVGKRLHSLLYYLGVSILMI